MKIRRLYKYYTLGWDFHIMILGQRNVPLREVIRTCENFQKFLQEFDFEVTKVAIGTDLDTILSKIRPLDQESSPSDEIQKEFKDFADSIEKTLDSELRLRKAYVLSEKRLGLEKLMNEPAQLFSSGTFDKLSELSKMDFTEAGKCISFERYTAAAFHILRGTEQALREFYLKKVKQRRVKKLLWYDMTQSLKGRKNIPDSLIAVLDSIREDFRNPTVHPEKTYGEDEAQSLLTHCSDVINRIIRIMK